MCSVLRVSSNATRDEIDSRNCNWPGPPDPKPFSNQRYSDGKLEGFRGKRSLMDWQLQTVNSEAETISGVIQVPSPNSHQPRLVQAAKKRHFVIAARAGGKLRRECLSLPDPRDMSRMPRSTAVPAHCRSSGGYLDPQEGGEQTPTSRQPLKELQKAGQPPLLIPGSSRQTASHHPASRPPSPPFPRNTNRRRRPSSQAPRLLHWPSVIVGVRPQATRSSGPTLSVFLSNGNCFRISLVVGLQLTMRPCQSHYIRACPM